MYQTLWILFCFYAGDYLCVGANFGDDILTLLVGCRVHHLVNIVQDKNEKLMITTDDYDNDDDTDDDSDDD